MTHKKKAIQLSFNLDYQTITLIKMKMFYVCFLYVLLLYGGFFFAGYPCIKETSK